MNIDAQTLRADCEWRMKLIMATTDYDDEIRAMGQIFNILRRFDKKAQNRIGKWMAERINDDRDAREVAERAAKEAEPPKGNPE